MTPSGEVSLRLIPGGRRDDPEGLLIERAGEIATLAGGIRRGRSQGDAAVLRVDTMAEAGTAALSARDEGQGLALASWAGRIVAVGARDEVERVVAGQGLPLDEFVRLDARGGCVTPGLVDPHTHLLFAGTREGEFRLRQRGAPYLEILAAGGGILSTVAATREASEDELLAHGRRWLAEMLRHGVTTVEAKSGYGLDAEHELRLLDAAGRLGDEGPVDVVPTYLGAHAVPREYRDRRDGTEAYVRSIVEEQLPLVASQGRARFCDVFCEKGVFSAEQSRTILLAARRMGILPRLHADELAASGGAELAAEVGAYSADHLAAISPAGMDALAEAADGPRPVVAVLLPATSWFLMSGHMAPARALIDRGIPVAIGTDFNPGTCPTPNLPLAMTVASIELKLTAAEALVATTINAAHALGLGEEIGSIEPGKRMDVVIWRVPTYEQIPYWPGADLVQAVIKRGRHVSLAG